MITKKRSAKKLSYGPSERKMIKGENLFHDLLINGLKDMYWAERYLAKKLPKMVKAATSSDLRGIFSAHIVETEEQARKLERVFQLIGEKASGKKCDAMAGLIDETTGIIDETEKGSYTRDAALIMAAQKTEHYEIASYGSLKEFAKTMGYHNVVLILDEILEEEKETDIALNDLAINSINEKARGEWVHDEENKFPV